MRASATAAWADATSEALEARAASALVAVMSTEGILRPQLGLGLGHRRPGLGHRDLLIRRIQLDQQLPGAHPLVIDHVNGLDGAEHPGAEVADVAVHLGVVGGLEPPGVRPVAGAARNQRRHQPGRQQPP